jgi:hypothetical protein
MLVYLLAYNLANQERLLIEDAAPQAIPATSGHQRLPDRNPLADYLMSRCGWSLQRFREQVLKVAARFVLGGREVVVVITGAAAELWQRLWRRLARLQPLTT